MSKVSSGKREKALPEQPQGVQPVDDDRNQSNNQSDDSLDIYAISESTAEASGQQNDESGIDNAIYYVVDRSTPPPDEPAAVPCEETNGDDVATGSDKNT